MPRPKRTLEESDPNIAIDPPQKSAKTKTEPAIRKQIEMDYQSLRKPELQKECAARGLLKTGSTADLIARLQATDEARKAKYVYCKDAPYSKEEAAKRPIGAKVAPAKSRASFGKDDPQQKILRRGPTGRPVYDAMGFEIDYHKVAVGRSRRPGCKTMSSKAYMDMLDKERRKRDRKTQIMGTHPDRVSGLTLMAWDDRISRDLGIPYHLVEMEDYEEWHRRGFKAEGAEFEAKNIPDEEQDRLTDLATGSAFRK